MKQNSRKTGWFIALFGASFAALAGFELAAKGLQLKRSLESTTHLSELKEPAQLAAELVPIVPVEAVMWSSPKKVGA